MYKKRPGMNKLIVQKVEVQTKTEAGFILGDNEESLIQKTTILAIGNCKDTGFYVGDDAFISRTAGVEIDHNEWLIREDEVLYTESDKIRKVTSEWVVNVPGIGISSGTTCSCVKAINPVFTHNEDCGVQR